MGSLRIYTAIIFAALVTSSACADPAPEGERCDGEIITTGDCEYDGECSGFRVCREGLCSTPEAMSGDASAGRISTGEESFQYELAASDLARQRGLAGRPCVADGWGLLLEWPDAAERQIDMSGMLFDLDLLFLDASDRPVSMVYGAVAGSKVLYSSDGEARRVLEVRAGALPDPVGPVSRTGD